VQDQILRNHGSYDKSFINEKYNGIIYSIEKYDKYVDKEVNLKCRDSISPEEIHLQDYFRQNNIVATMIKNERN